MVRCSHTVIATFFLTHKDPIARLMGKRFEEMGEEVLLANKYTTVL